ncbi:Similar to Uncharacterized calcium-binding protein C800.10c; acc. no. Q9HGL2 [Pyronema omphalodes CBS 100304]|uniref:Similar to Uncharacterized calcium-binding protein C800.10c acc. no. Q9HGL2 n=1 Tax=Pyronema omphalodes (strain CBS 100304) TaxID=1076935 RepID=U4LCR1_PYROM|nr:Similar to Uncharacterized calcium-binding protein C800.10c; acc. no. Q9HGL2 [Pyronema omphalodes CBS 100304]
MSDQRDSLSEAGGSGHPSIVLTPEEKSVFGQLFRAADTENIGVVTGELAVKFFEKSGLSPRILGEIWGIADTENRGYLTKQDFCVALRLIGQAQSNQHPRPELAQQPGPLPRFEAVNIVYPTGPSSNSPPPPVIPPQPTGPAGMIRVPPLMPQDVEKFTALFEKSGAIDGLLQGTIARDIFQRSKLSNAQLIQIWNLADRQGRGALGCVEFVVAMHLITCCKNGSLPALPQILPPGLYEAATGRPTTRNGPDRRGPGGQRMPPVPPIPKQFSGSQGAQRAQSPLSRNFTPPVPQNANAIQRDLTGGGWLVSAQDKARFDSVFLTVDTTGRGVITGEEAVTFFGKSLLPEDVLAQIWDLADINKAAAPPAPTSASNDLFELGDFSAPQAGPSASAGPFGDDAWAPQGSKDVSPNPSAAHSPIPPQVSGGLFGRPQPAFVPTSSFGQSIIPNATGGSHRSASGGFAPQPKPQEMDDLLGDADPEVSSKLTNESTELANLSNQIGSLTKQTQELNIKRVSTESEITSLATQKQNIEAQLAQLRAAYQSEAEAVRQVEDQLARSRQDTTALSMEYQKIEAEYTQLQYKKQEVSSQLEADKRENENLKERMNVINAENRTLKEELERLEMQSRRERGMVAINKKQVEKSEQEREKLKGGIEETTRSNATSPVPPGSPTLSQSSLNTKNPFARSRSPPVSEHGFGSNSPFAPKQPPASMDDVFGPSFSSTPPPQMSFGHRAQDSSSYTPSVPESSAHGGRSTPPTSPPQSSYHSSPQSSEAPPPPTGSQMTSAFLPLQVNRADSVTSSVQVNPSASVSAFSRPDTPTNVFAPAADSPARERDSFMKEDRRSSFSVKSDAGSESMGMGGRSNTFSSPFDRRVDSPFAVEKNTTGTTSGGDDTTRPNIQKSDSFRDFASVPGGFPTHSEIGIIKPTPTGESTMSNRSRKSNRSAFGNDPFSMSDRVPSASSKDLDDAFGMSKFPRVDPHHTGGSGSINTSKFHDEFPPIKEVRPDSDSESEGGFDDNFTTASPVQTKAQPQEPQDLPPTISAQQSPPTYQGSQDKSPYPDFGGLLPSRTDPMAHDAPTPGGSSNAVVFPPAAGGFDDFDESAFGDLSEAKEADKDASADDFGVSPNAFDDFNPVFDTPTSPVHQGAEDGGAQKPPQQQEDWDAIFAGFGDAVTTGATGAAFPSTATPAAAPFPSAVSPAHTGSNQQPQPTAEEDEKKGTKPQPQDQEDNEDVRKLTGMGFDRSAAVKELEKAGGSVDRAVEALIAGGST